jgi:ABC-type multidrug transport system fused ATPase/permease subunit
MRYDSIKRSEATSKTFLDVIQSDEQKTRGSNTGKDEPQWLENRDINFSQVSFRYPQDKKDVLCSCTFTVPAGKTTLLLGPSGSGKTTIARLLLKFWHHDQGSIQVGGRQINEYSGRKVRAHMSYVSQGDHIVDDTIRDNLSWGFSKTGSISPERMRDIIDVVAINTSNKGGDILGLLAKDLSIGEQQRLSIARMMLDESEIVIMDEPLAGVDVFTIRDLLPHLTRLLRERNHTVVMISHRLAFAGCADHVVVLIGFGEVVEQGAPKDLILSNGVFASLHEAAVAELSLNPDPEH